MATFQEKFLKALNEGNFAEAASLSAQSPDFAVRLASEYNNLELLKEFTQTAGIKNIGLIAFAQAVEDRSDRLVAHLAELVTTGITGIDRHRLLVKVCGRSLQQTLGVLVRRLRYDKAGICSHENDIFIDTCRRGDLEFAKYLTATFALNSQDARAQSNKPLHMACLCGHLALAKWLVQRFDLHREDAVSENNYAIQAACAGGHLHLSRWLAETFELTREDISAQDIMALRSADDNGFGEVVEWIGETFHINIADLPAQK